MESTVNQAIEPSCVEKFNLIRRDFSFLTDKYGYEIIFLARQGRHNCVFGMEAKQMPKFILGGEDVYYIAVSTPQASYNLDFENSFRNSWLNVVGLSSFLSGGSPLPWLDDEDPDSIPQFYEWKELSDITERLMPWIINTFSDLNTAENWRIEYDKAAKKQSHDFFGYGRLSHKHEATSLTEPSVLDSNPASKKETPINKIARWARKNFFS
jgi:hypothetical protein